MVGNKNTLPTLHLIGAGNKNRLATRKEWWATIFTHPTKWQQKPVSHTEEMVGNKNTLPAPYI
ncbi:MAG: hypothetical protein DRR16_24730 [Candidatus Parabeggiatoa sp. nov. 3]|nr:MAG: hypothetical protein DRR00_31665 [Gammaproteobacteria bacterium]RKZ79960.1 MAG: hypothetical protein DRR16_24730 [Gammaproteobacteria bacterium]